MEGGNSGFGTVFVISTNGTGKTTLHHFSDIACIHPAAALVQGTDGLLYGTTYGSSSSVRGSVFQLATNGSAFSILHVFDGAATSSAAPLVQAGDGTLFGTTYYGGSDDVGSVFEIQPDGSGFDTLCSLHLAETTDAWSPDGALVLGTNGVLYGTTWSGGEENFGTVFQINQDGTGYQVLHSFTPGSGDGDTPATALLFGLDGALYGTTLSGGANDAGVLFRLSADGSDYSILHSFGSGPTDGRGGRPDARPSD